MAQSETFLMKAARIHTYIGEGDVQYPEHDGLDPASMATAVGWKPLGYTSKETPFAITAEGGETTTLDTAEEDAVVPIAAAVSRAIDIKAHQFDAETLDLAYNGTYDAESKTYKVPTTSQPLVKRLLVVVSAHNGKRYGFGARCAITVGEEPTVSFEALSQIGLKATVLGDSGTSLTLIGIEKSGV